MPKHLERGLRQLNDDLLSMAATVADAVEVAITALLERKAAPAHQVIQLDDEIDRDEINLEDECLKLLALNQPVASDLRRVVAILKINGELERMADLAGNIAARALALISLPAVATSPKFRLAAQLTGELVKLSIEAFVEENSHLARRVCRQDLEIDRLTKELNDELIGLMKTSSEQVPQGLSLFSSARHLERIAGHATNIAEDVIYLIDGKIVRHRPEAFQVRG